VMVEPIALVQTTGITGIVRAIHSAVPTMRRM
jgi:hypothetical protein